MEQVTLSSSASVSPSVNGNADKLTSCQRLDSLNSSKSVPTGWPSEQQEDRCPSELTVLSLRASSFTQGSECCPLYREDTITSSKEDLIRSQSVLRVSPGQVVN